MSTCTAIGNSGNLINRIADFYRCTILMMLVISHPVPLCCCLVLPSNTHNLTPSGLPHILQRLNASFLASCCSYLFFRGKNLFWWASFWWLQKMASGGSEKFVGGSVKERSPVVNANCTAISPAKCIANENLVGVVYRPHSSAAAQMDLDRVKKWIKRDLMKFSKGKCQVLYLWRSKLWVASGWNWVAGKQLGRKGPGVLVDQKLIMNQQRATAPQKVKKHPGWWSLLSAQSWWDTIGVLCPVLGSPVQGRHERPGHTSKVPGRWLRDWNVWCTWKLKGLQLLRL